MISQRQATGEPEGGAPLVPDHFSLDAVPPPEIAALATIDEGNRRIVEQIREVQALSEREILSCGNVLSAMVGNAQSLADESSRAAAASLALSNEMASRFVRAMQHDIAAQKTAAQTVLDLARAIEQAVDSINDLTLSSKVLAINARIEAARLGDQGKGAAAIADSIRALSATIRAASDRVGASVAAMREGLAPMNSHAASMDQRTQSFIAEISAAVRSAALQSGDGEAERSSLKTLLELSNQALSHLQFQDPMAQKLNSIAAEIERTRQRVSSILLEHNHNTGANSHPGGLAPDSPPPGEIMLF